MLIDPGVLSGGQMNEMAVGCHCLQLISIWHDSHWRLPILTLRFVAVRSDNKWLIAVSVCAQVLLSVRLVYAVSFSNGRADSSVSSKVW